MLKNLIFFCFLVFCLPFMSNSLFLLFSVFFSAFILVVWVAVNISTPFSTITFLVYISGLLVVFSYLIAMNPNFLYKSSLSTLPFLILFLSIVCNKDIIFTNEVSLKTGENLSYMYSYSSMGLYTGMAIFLLMCLVGVVSVSYKSPKPLRGMSSS